LIDLLKVGLVQYRVAQKVEH